MVVPSFDAIIQSSSLYGTRIYDFGWKKTRILQKGINNCLFDISAKYGNRKKLEENFIKPDYSCNYELIGLNLSTIKELFMF